jgi:hypothetical protein
MLSAWRSSDEPATSEGEMTMQWIVAWGLVAVAASALAAVLAGFKNRDYSYWMAWCFVVPPLVLWLLMLPKNKGERPRQPRLDDIDRRENGPL